MKPPYFICIGAQKSGTTWLYEQLKLHPDVKLPPLKEIHYFDELHREVKTDIMGRLFDSNWMNKRWRKTTTYWLKKIAKFNYVEERWFFNYLFRKRDLNWYCSLFDFDNYISGDITPDYTILDIEEVKRIKDAFPELKIVFLMRNPLERKWSQVKMVLNEKRGVTLSADSFNEYYKACLEWDDTLGDYPKVFSTWAEVFGSDQFYYDYYDNLTLDPISFYSGILEFLGLPKSFDEAQVKKRVYSGRSINIPPEMKDVLVKTTSKTISELKQHVNDIPNEWSIYCE